MRGHSAFRRNHHERTLGFARHPAASSTSSDLWHVPGRHRRQDECGALGQVGQLEVSRERDERHAAGWMGATATSDGWKGGEAKRRRLVWADRQKR